MPTDKQIEATRINGAKSNGPATPEGKEASSRNARKHGFSARKFILEQEDFAEFNGLLTAYRDRFRPADRVEDDLVAPPTAPIDPASEPTDDAAA